MRAARLAARSQRRAWLRWRQRWRVRFPSALAHPCWKFARGYVHTPAQTALPPLSRRTRAARHASYTVAIHGEVQNLRDLVYTKLHEVAASAAQRGSTSADAASSASSASASLSGSKRPRSAGGAAAPAAAAAAAALDARLANFKGTPIIIVPPTVTSCISMYNAPQFLQDGVYVTPEEAMKAAGGAPKPAKVTIRRKDSRGEWAQYHIIDDANLLKDQDWYGAPRGCTSRRRQLRVMQRIHCAPLVVDLVHVGVQGEGRGRVCAGPGVAVCWMALGSPPRSPCRHAYRNL
ncbi:hypothetical protein EON67_00440 [archaeon]|nr:MAG: hypothetical protein EON67_00440 [archaeon]